MRLFDVGGLVRLYGKLVEDEVISRQKSGVSDVRTRDVLLQNLAEAKEYADDLCLDTHRHQLGSAQADVPTSPRFF
jgi:hypothetical protein